MTVPSAKLRDLAEVHDAELVGLARAGSEPAFREIMRRHNRRLYRVARGIVGDPGEAEDVVQETYLRAFAHLGDFRGDAALSTWLTRIALNEALGRKRRRKPTVELSEVDALGQSDNVVMFPMSSGPQDPEAAAAQAQMRRMLERAVDELPESFRLVFVMREVEEMSVEETAAYLELRPETVRTRLHRARRLLRKSLDERLSAALSEAFSFDGARCARMADAVMARLNAGPAASIQSRESDPPGGA
jgi:RNA polymerase sigma-70 factor (ECF subfamily)